MVLHNKGITKKCVIVYYNCIIIVTYHFQLAALTVNGTGPYTQSSLAETFANDLDENRVPDKPVGLKGNIYLYL